MSDDDPPRTDDDPPRTDDDPPRTDDDPPATDRRAVACDPIGTVSTPFPTREDAPRQGALADAEGTVHVDPSLEPGLAGIEPGDRVVVVWYADRADRSRLRVRDGDRGVFASRSPDRPTPVCLTTSEVLAVDGPDLRVRGVDMLDGSPVLDLKPALDGE